MAIKLSRWELENITKYKYETNPATPLDKIFDPWWNFLVNRLPWWVSPNLITLCGIVVPVLVFLYLI